MGVFIASIENFSFFMVDKTFPTQDVMRLRHNENFRISDAERAEIERMAREWGVSRSSVWRKLLMTVKVLYDSDLMLSDALKIDDRTLEVHQLLAQGHDLPLHQAIRPIPNLIKILEAKSVMKTLELNRRRKLRR